MCVSLSSGFWRASEGVRGPLRGPQRGCGKPQRGLEGLRMGWAVLRGGLEGVRWDQEGLRGVEGLRMASEAVGRSAEGLRGVGSTSELVGRPSAGMDRASVGLSSVEGLRRCGRSGQHLRRGWEGL